MLVHLLEALRYKSEGRRLDSRFGALEFYIGFILPAALWPSTDVSNKVSSVV
jgi:hypothetical protein